MAFLDKAGLEHLWLHITNKLNQKVDKISGKMLSSNDFTNEEKESLKNIADTYVDKEYLNNVVAQKSQVQIITWEAGD